jgi:hypothetical protein
LATAVLITSSGSQPTTHNRQLTTNNWQFKILQNTLSCK